MYDKLVPKVNNFVTSEFVLKTKHNTDKPDKKYRYETSYAEKKFLILVGLATSSALTAVKNEIHDVNNLVKKTDYDTKINEMKKKDTNHNQDKYITTSEFNNRKFCCKTSASKFNKDKF